MRYTGNRIVGSNPTLSAIYPQHLSPASGRLTTPVDQAGYCELFRHARTSRNGCACDAAKSGAGGGKAWAEVWKGAARCQSMLSPCRKARGGNAFFSLPPERRSLGAPACRLSPPAHRSCRWRCAGRRCRATRVTGVTRVSPNSYRRKMLFGNRFRGKSWPPGDTLAIFRRFFREPFWRGPAGAARRKAERPAALRVGGGRRCGRGRW